jgi:hypothetical protein
MDFSRLQLIHICASEYGVELRVWESWYFLTTLTRVFSLGTKNDCIAWYNHIGVGGNGIIPDPSIQPISTWFHALLACHLFVTTCSWGTTERYDHLGCSMLASSAIHPLRRLMNCRWWTAPEPELFSSAMVTEGADSSAAAVHYAN